MSWPSRTKRLSRRTGLRPGGKLRRAPMRETKPREGSRRAIERDLHAEVRLRVIPRDGACVCCGSKKNLQIGHFFSRTNKSIAFDLVNCNAQCADCNQIHNYRQRPYLEYMIRRWGWDEIDRLNRLRWANEYVPTPKLVELLESLRAYRREGLRVERVLNQEVAEIEDITGYENYLEVA